MDSNPAKSPLQKVWNESISLPTITQRSHNGAGVKTASRDGVKSERTLSGPGSGLLRGQLPDSFFQTRIGMDFNQNNFNHHVRKRYFSDNFSPNLFPRPETFGVNLQAIFPALWPPINSARDIFSYDLQDRFAPAVEESEDTNVFSRTIGFLGLDDPLHGTKSTNASNENIIIKTKEYSTLSDSLSISRQLPASKSFSIQTPSKETNLNLFSGLKQTLLTPQMTANNNSAVDKILPDSSTYNSVHKPESFPETVDENAHSSSFEHTYPSRSLWIGNIDSSLKIDDLNCNFSAYGEIESVRLLPEKECAFVNFVDLKDALDARTHLQGETIGNCVLRIGFGKNDALLETQGVGNILQSTKPADLEAVFSQFGKVESTRILTHKNCGFVNFVSLADAIVARKELNGQDICGSPVKIGFAKVPQKSEQPLAAQIYMPNIGGVPINRTSSFGQQEPWTQRIEKTPEPQVNIRGKEPILSISDLKTCRKHDQSRLLQMRKTLEGNISGTEIRKIITEVLPEADVLCSDYIGNVIIQKLIEKSNDAQQLLLIKKIAPKIAALGIHKNGTWAVQKIIDTAKLSTHISVIVESLKPYASALLMDQFGNYVIQCCLRLGSEWSQFIFDTISFNILEIGQGRYGARATKACLESPNVSKEQQMQVSISIAQNCVHLSSNYNGAILLTWLLDESDIAGKCGMLVPIMVPHIVALACHKLSCTFLLKIVSGNEPDARHNVISEIFKDSNLGRIFLDHSVGMPFITKLISSCPTAREKQELADRVKKSISISSSSEPNPLRLFNE